MEGTGKIRCAERLKETGNHSYTSSGFHLIPGRSKGVLMTSDQSHSTVILFQRSLRYFVWTKRRKASSPRRDHLPTLLRSRCERRLPTLPNNLERNLNGIL